MRARSRIVGCVLFPAIVAAACGGTAVYPRVGAGTDRNPALPPMQPPASHPAPDIAERRGTLTVRQVCRNPAPPRGWVATAYVQGGEECPRREGDSGYNVAIIERVSDASVAVMTMCADQPVPRGWRRDLGVTPERECAGARVAAHQPTSVVIRRR